MPKFKAFFMENYKKKTTYDKIVEIVALAALVWAFCPPLFNSIDSDAILPVHFNLVGEVDGWGDSSVLWIIPPIALLLYIGLSILQKFPKVYNYPCEVTEENANYLYRMGVQLIRHIKVSIVLTFAYINYDIYAVAIGRCASPNLFIIGMLIGITLLPIIICFSKMSRYKPKL